MALIHVIFYFPKTEERKLTLALRTSEIRANAMIRQIKDLNCSRQQKLERLDTVIESQKMQQSLAIKGQLNIHRPSRWMFICGRSPLFLADT